MVAAAVIGTVATGVIGGVVANNAANRAADASQNATDASVALQREILGIQQANTATSRAVGDAAILKLAQQFGLSPQAVASTAGTMGVPVEGQYAAPAQGQQIDQDWLTRNPDVAAEGQKQVRNGTFQNMGQYLAWHQDAYGDEGRGSYLLAAAPAQDPDAIRSTPLPQEPAITQPAQAGVTTANDIDSRGYYTGVRPTVGAAPTYVAPTYRETAVAPLDVSLGSYQQSPDYQFQQEEGSKRILATASATGGLESGAALKALQERGQSIALGDYSQWRNFAAGQFNQDRAYTANRDDAYNSFGQSTALAQFGADQGNYQFGTNLGQSIFNSNRDYATGRSDYNTGALMSLAGYGQNATNANNGALSSAASNIGNAYFSNANNQGNAALSSAGQINNLLSAGGGALAYYYGNQRPATGALGGASALSYTNDGSAGALY